MKRKKRKGWFTERGERLFLVHSRWSTGSKAWSSKKTAIRWGEGRGGRDLWSTGTVD